MFKTKINIYASVMLLLTFIILNTINSRANSPVNLPQSAGNHFKGSISQSKFDMTLQRSGSQLNGSYFYIKSGSGNALTLRGKIGADNKFTLQEFDASGKQTGEFTGVWKDDPNESGASLEGDWKKMGAKDAQGFWASEQMISFTDGTQVTSKQISEPVKAKRLDITADYPELTGGAKTAGFNQTVKTLVMQQIAEFKKEVMAFTAEDLKAMPAGMNNYLDIGYNVEYADNDLISVSFLAGTFTGGAHPNYNSFTVTYDLKNDKQINLNDLFKPGAKYLGTISAYTLKDLQNRKSPEDNQNLGLAQDIFADGAKPTVENYQNWNITKKGLMFTFDPYQVASYAAGQQYIIIPYSALKDIARSDSALAKTMK